ncbi:alpha/beta fold hydrolase [Corynebacterium sp.]|uniref:alpha/beta fold hydrolase n=1 Tax=Corynebacterium sp. TaxID=1720 RepID=UPI0026DBF5A7|nr:alpha/beta fold hydrolase [Corynebacterium sp.]MDO5076084.1 alpha/beta fold hydrolase [Corynebacterium sp.]
MTLRTSAHRRFGFTVRSHTLTVPWDRASPQLGTLDIFAREIVPDGGEDWPIVVYLQGGPGFPSPQFLGPSGWMETILQKHRLLLLDQRGTGRSGSALIDAPTIEPTYFTLLRADNIVADCEDFRNALGVEKWSLFGQSFGGFCITTYLSRFPDAVHRAYITGGLPATDCHVDDVYRATFARTQVRHERFYAQFPWADQRIREICHHLKSAAELLPTGERLSARRFRTIGIELGRGLGFDRLGYLLEDPFVMFRGEKRLRKSFLSEVGQRVSFAGNPLYAVVHEAIYGGTVKGQTNWSAHRIREEIPGFAESANPCDFCEPYFLTAEHIFPWQFIEDPALKPYAEVAATLAAKADWDCLYNRDVLSEASAVCAAAVYYDDIFVPMDLSLETAGVFRDLRLHITNQFQHDGIGVDGGGIVGTLLAKTNEY